MSAEETKPAATEVAPPLPTDGAATVPAVDSTETPAATTTADVIPAAGAEDTAAAVTAPAEEKKEEKVVEAIYSGALGYKAHHAGFDLK